MVRRLLYLNGIAIVAVVLFHTAGMGFVAMFSWSHRYLPEAIPASTQIGTLPYYGLRILEQISVFALPFFLFVSGYYIAVQSGRSGNIGWAAIRSRIKNLVIPYLFWSLVVVILAMAQGGRFGPVELVVMFLTGQTNEVLYFVPLLIQFYLLAPFFVLLARRNWKALLVITAVVQALIIALPYPIYFGINTAWSQQLATLVPKWLFIAKIFWFPLGIVAGFHSEALLARLQKMRFGLLAGAALLTPLALVQWEFFFQQSGLAWLPHRETFTDSLYSIMLLFGLLGLENKMLPAFSRVSEVGLKSYGIYLTHAIFIEFTARIIYRFAPELLGYQILLQPILILVGLGGRS
jgi:peptidoglycan/LPS O-acetylase OafA/YrhL